MFVKKCQVIFQKQTALVTLHDGAGCGIPGGPFTGSGSTSLRHTQDHGPDHGFHREMRPNRGTTDQTLLKLKRTPDRLAREASDNLKGE